VLFRGLVTGLILLGVAAAAVYYTRSPHDRYALQLRVFHPDAASSWEASAQTYDVRLRRGQKYVAAVPDGGHVFLDLFRRTEASREHVASAPADRTQLEIEISADGDYTLRVRVDPPSWMRHDEVNGRRFCAPAEVEFAGVRVRRGSD